MGRGSQWACGRLVVALGLIGAFAAAQAQSAWALEVRSGPLSVEVREAPFGLDFVDRGDGEVLRTRSATAPGPDDPLGRYGSISYSYDLRIPVINNAFLGYYVAAEVETLWFSAQEVVSSERSGDGLRLELATNDPLGHRLELTINPLQPGSVRVGARVAPGSGPLAGLETITGASFETDGAERFLGFGERSNAVDQSGRRVFNWAEEGPFSSGAGEALLRDLVPEFTFPTGPSATNFPIPWTVTSRGFGLLIDQSERSYFRLGSDTPGAWRAEAESDRLRFDVFAGPEPADALRRYSSFAGRQPRPAPWIFGPWVQMPQDVAERFRRDDVPVTVSQTYTHYLPCGAHLGRAAAEREAVSFHHRLGYKVTTYFNPHVCTTYQPVYAEAAANGWLVRDAGGGPYVLSNPFTADELVSEVDFTAPGGSEFFGRLLGEAVDAGYDGWMEDFGEYTPTDAVFADGRRGLEMHNRYPVLYHCSSFEQTGEQAPAVFVRSGWHGVQPCARVVWGGDPTEDWSCSDGLCAAVHQALSAGLSGIAYWGSDIGGFHALVNPRTSDELNIRWLEFGLVNGVMRTQRNGFGLSDRSRRSQVWDPDVLPVWRRYAKLRTQLYPYIQAASDVYQRTGMPLSRQLSLVFPNDPIAASSEEELMFGPDLLVAPVVTDDARSRQLYLPRGRWIDFWETVGYRAAAGEFSLQQRARTLAGGRRLALPAPLERLPMLVRAGALIPLLPADVDTLAEVGRDAPGIVSRGERSATRRILAFPRGNSSAGLDGGRLASTERLGGPRRWTLEIHSARNRTWEIEASMTALRRPFVPCELTVGGEPLASRGWSYDATDQVLRLSVRAKVTVIAASGASQCRA